MTDTSKSLRYDMGNIGDLLKHGVMAEFIRWWSDINSDKNNFVFLDPFCGLRWEYPENKCILRRLCNLRDNHDGDFAIISAQPGIDDGKYYGSTHVVINQTLQIPRKKKLQPVIYVSDESPDKIMALEKSNEYIKKLSCHGFSKSDGYLILDYINGGNINADMALIDPYCEMDKIISYLSEIIKACEKTAIILFVIINNKGKWKEIKQKLSPNSIILTCPSTGETSCIRGEGRKVGVVLSSYLLTKTKNDSLLNNIRCYADALSKIAFLPDAKKKICVFPPHHN